VVVWLKHIRLCRRRAAECEKAHGTAESLDELLARAVKFCPHAEVLWLMWAKERWMAGDVQAAREILRQVRPKPSWRPSCAHGLRAHHACGLPCVLHLCDPVGNIVCFDAGPGKTGCPGMQAHAAKADSEAIWLAAFKLEFENKEPVRAAALMVKARESPVQTQRVWMKSAIVERELVRPLSPACAYCCQSCRRLAVPCIGMLHATGAVSPSTCRAVLVSWARTSMERSACCVLLGVTVQIGTQGNTEEEQRLLEEGLQRFPAFDKLWLMLGQLEERRGRAAAARTAYQNGLKRCIHRFASVGCLATLRPPAHAVHASAVLCTGVVCSLDLP